LEIGIFLIIRLSDRNGVKCFLMKVFSILTKILFIICIPFFLFTASIGIAVNSHWLYTAGFEKYNITQVTGITLPELNKAASGLIKYFNSGEEYINLQVIKNGEPFTLFNDKEVQHLKDVKGLIWFDYWVLIGTFAYLLIYAGFHERRKANKRNLAQGLFGGGILTIVLGLVLGVGILFGFDQLFWNFHLISFSNDFWLLDPTKDYMIMMFPGDFWYDAFGFVAILTLGLAVIVGAMGGVYLRIISKIINQKHR
jgi:integral membrane protein (TIGR01906 family)